MGHICPIWRSRVPGLSKIKLQNKQMNKLIVYEIQYIIWSIKQLTLHCIANKDLYLGMEHWYLLGLRKYTCSSQKCIFYIIN